MQLSFVTDRYETKTEYYDLAHTVHCYTPVFSTQSNIGDNTPVFASRIRKILDNLGTPIFRYSVYQQNLILNRLVNSLSSKRSLRSCLTLYDYKM